MSSLADLRVRGDVTMAGDKLTTKQPRGNKPTGRKHGLVCE